MIKKEQNGLIYFEFDRLSQEKNINHFISTRINNRNSEFNLSLYKTDKPEQVISNRKKLAGSVIVPFDMMVFQQQIHSTNIHIVSKGDDGKGTLKYDDGIPDNDAMITNEPGVCLNVMAGDCVPLVFYDPVKRVVAVAHAGWRGTYKRIAENTIRKMEKEFACVPSNIFAGIGPSISQKNYEVDGKVYAEFDKRFDNLSKIFIAGNKDGKYYLNLWEANRQQLISAGLKEKNIELSNICTFEQNDLFFSARRGDKGRFMAGIILEN